MTKLILPAAIVALISLVSQNRCYAFFQTDGTSGGVTQPNVCSIDLPPKTDQNNVVHLSLDSDHNFVKNGSIWVPKGVGIRAFGLTTAVAASSPFGATILNAQYAYGDTEMEAARSIFHANALRFQVDQDPLAQNQPDFMKCLKNAIRIARNHGLIVVLSIQAEGAGNVYTALPTKTTLAALLTLNALYKDNQAVLYELYNEPHGMKTDTSLSQSWLRWKCGDPIVDDGSDLASAEISSRAACLAQYPGTTADTGSEQDPPAIGMQILVDALRHDHSTNVLMVNGLGRGNSLHGIYDYSNAQMNYLLSDSQNLSHPDTPQISYSVHPYAYGIDLADSNYEMSFGFGTQKQMLPATVLVSEWSATTRSMCGAPGLDGLPTFHPALDLINFMNQHKFPLLAGEMDAAGVLSQPASGTNYVPMYNAPLSSWVATNYNNLPDNSHLDPPNSLDAGLLISNFFINEKSTAGQPNAYSCAAGVIPGNDTGCAAGSANPTMTPACTY